MKLILNILLLSFLLSSSGFSQPLSCKDSLNVNTYYICNTPEYSPVCGCDQVTYRNSCAAEHWGGLINNGYSWVDGICGNFDFDFVPTAIQYNPVQFGLFMKEPGSATLYIYNRYGGLLYSDYYSATMPGQIITRELNLQRLEIGVYFALVVVNGEKQYRKFAKLINSAPQ